MEIMIEATVKGCETGILQVDNKHLENNNFVDLSIQGEDGEFTHMAEVSIDSLVSALAAFTKERELRAEFNKRLVK